MFTPEQLAALAKPLAEERISHRRQAGVQLSYIETWDAMDTANRIFCYDGWHYTLDRLEQQGDVWIAIVTVTVLAGDRLVSRQDVGVGIPAKRREDPTPTADATETAIKGAVSDATKRALRSFGSQFGLILYSKDAPENGSAPAPERETTNHSGEDVMEVQRGVLSRLKTILQKTKYDPAAYEDLRAAWLKTAGVEHWGKLSAAQWRTYEREMTNRLGGEIPTVAEPGTWEATASQPASVQETDCPTCGAPMVHREGTNKAGKAYSGFFCSDRDCKQTPLWDKAAR